MNPTDCDSILEVSFDFCAELTAELASARDLDAVVEIVVKNAADALGASVATLSLVTEPDTMTLR